MKRMIDEKEYQTMIGRISELENKKLYTTNISLSITPDEGDTYIDVVGDNIGYLKEVIIELSVTTSFKPDEIEDISDFNEFIASIGDYSGDTSTILKGCIRIKTSLTEAGAATTYNVPSEIYIDGSDEYISYVVYYASSEHSALARYFNNTVGSYTYTINSVNTFEI